MALLKANSRLVCQPFDGEPPMDLCELVDRGGGAARYLLPRGSGALLRSFDGTDEADVVTRRYLEASPQEGLSERATKLCVARAQSLGLLVDVHRDEADVARAGLGARYLAFRVTLIPQRVVSAVTALLGWLFRPAVALLLLSGVVVAEVVVVAVSGRYVQDYIDRLTPQNVAVVLLVSSGIGIWHELGHATALRFYGYSTASIGWGVYLTMKVFYTDLSDAWKLPRYRRAVVDLGGLYFQSLAVACLVPFAIASNSTTAMCVIWLNNLQIVTSLNPLLRLDGYWFLSDVCGIADLRSRSRRLMETWVVRLCRGSAATSTVNKVGDTWPDRVIALYTVATVPLFVVATVWIGSHIVSALVPAIVERVQELNLRIKDVPTLMAAVASIAGILWRAMTLYGVAVFAYRGALTLVRSTRDVAIRLRSRGVQARAS